MYIYIQLYVYIYIVYMYMQYIYIYISCLQTLQTRRDIYPAVTSNFGAQHSSSVIDIMRYTSCYGEVTCQHT